MHEDKLILRDRFAYNAPITLEQVLVVFGDPEANMQNDDTRAAVNGLWSFMRYEYADAMLAERANRKEHSDEIGKIEDDAIITEGMEALRQLVNEWEDLSGLPAYRAMLRPHTWDDPHHPMYLARRALALYAANTQVAASHPKEASSWLKWYGAEIPPVRENIGVDVRYSNGTVLSDRIAGDLSWLTIPAFT